MLVELDRGEICCRIVRDRSQWTLDIGFGDRTFRRLAIYLTAMTGASVVIPDPPDSSVPPASQLPVDVSWADTVPTVIDWLSTESRSSVVETAAVAHGDEGLVAT